MIAWVSGLRIGVGRFTRPWRGVGVRAMPDARLDATRRIQSVCEVPPEAGVLRLGVPGMGVGVISDRRRVVEGVTVIL
jgi:hypothetical protein